MSSFYQKKMQKEATIFVAELSPHISSAGALTSSSNFQNYNKFALLVSYPT